MNRKRKMIAILLSLVFCLSVCMLSVYAEDANLDGYDDDTGEPVATSYVEPDTIEPPTEYYTEPVTEAPTEPATTYAPATEPETVNNNYDYNNDGGNDDTYSNNNDNDYNDYNSYSEPADRYIGGGQSVYVEPETTAPSAPLYDTDDHISDDELSNRDWNDIASSLKLTSESGGSDSDDFDFIQKNDATSDNGDWMLIVGIICLVLSAAGIAYFIISTVMQRKKLNTPHAGAKPAAAGAYSGGGRRSANDYGDGYRSQRSDKRRSKYDTADVKLPKSSSGGKHGR